MDISLLRVKAHKHNYKDGINTSGAKWTYQLAANIMQSFSLRGNTRVQGL